MTDKDVVRFFLKYWPELGTYPDSNAPPMLRSLVDRFKGQDLNLVRESLKSILDDSLPADPSPGYVLGWINKYPYTRKHADSILAAKNRPKTFDGLLIRIYNDEFLTVLNKTKKYIAAIKP